MERLCLGSAFSGMKKGYKNFRVQATPKGEDKRIDKESDSEWECHELVQKWERENPNPYKDSE